VLPSEPLTNEVVTLTATVTASSETPSGTVEFKDGANAIPNCTRTPVNGAGIATCKSVFAASEAPVQLSALYSPDPGVDLQGSVAPTEDLEVGASPTTTTLRASEATITTGGSITLTASVYPVNGGGPSRPSGSVEFLDEGTPISACENQPLAPGELDASCHLTYTTADTHSITATYSGDDNFAGSSSSAQSVTVTSPATMPNTPTITTTGTTSPTLGTTLVASGPGQVVIANTSITTQRDGDATLKLACAGAGTCSGKLTLTVSSAVPQGTGHAATAKNGKADKRRFKTRTIGSATFSIPAGKSTTVRIALNSVGRALLKADHGVLNPNRAVGV
jgi:hypothetical protein